MALREAIRHPFNEGSGSSSLVPDLWDCAIGGRTFMFDDKYFGTQSHKLSSIPLLRPTQSTGEVTEEAFNPADGIRVTQRSWHHGAGQLHLDRKDSDEFRFRSSKGVDVWTKGKLSLLPDTEMKAEGNPVILPVRTRLYVADRFSSPYLRFTTDITPATPSFTTVTGTPGAVNTNGLTSDGTRVWTAHGASGIYETTSTTSSTASRTTGTVDGPIAYVKGRLMAASGAALYNVVDLDGAAVALPSALFTHPNPSFAWVGFADGQNNIYAAGYAGDKSEIYRTAVKADGTSLDVPVVAARLPDGEIVTAISEYLGLILIGTDKGWWTASQDSNGDLTINKVQNTTQAVRCFEGQGDFVWYGWSGYDTDSTGLGRADLRSDTKGADVVTPAYASDLMASINEDELREIYCICTFQGLRVFSVDTDEAGNVTYVGVWAEAATEDDHDYGSPLSGGGGTGEGTKTLVASGTLDSGLIDYGMPDDKVALNATVRHEPLDGTVALAVSTDAGTFSTVGTSVVADSTVAYFNPAGISGGTFETRITITRSATDDTISPTVTGATLESNMAPGRGQKMNLALLFFERQNFRGQDFTFDPVAAYDDLLELERSGAPTTVQHPLGAVTATLDDHNFVIEDFTEKRNGYIGTFLAEFRVGRRRS